MSKKTIAGFMLNMLIILTAVISFAEPNVFMEICPEITVSAEADIPSGDGSSDYPYEISSEKQLVWFADQVNNRRKNTLHAKLTKNIDLSSVCGPESADGKKAEKSWTPIGIDSDTRFSGTFNGNNKKITGLYINSPTGSYQGLFGYISQGTVKNLYVSGNIIGNSDVGSICGYSENSSFEKCTFGPDEETGSNSSINGKGNYIGGICGHISGKSSFSECVNKSSVNGRSHTGGICGYSYINGTSASTSKCINEGTVSGSEEYTGGIIGRTYYGTMTLSECTNTKTGAINGTITTGGICGQLYSGSMTGCENHAEITGTSNVGGICGKSPLPSSQLSDCKNFNTVNGTGYVGGICGNSSGDIILCENSAAVKGSESYIGGICGLKGTRPIQECSNSGEIYSHALQNTPLIISAVYADTVP